uniref:DDE Tnp4 domain-containing protein n=1 Tax=Cajanus cajan TaxID=3821 RepID=A0A151TEH4_CAJCA|nr:hypothetical protein KK1_011695 [Cajanus cajan]
MTMFLHILAHNVKYIIVYFSYCISKEIISKQFNNVLRVVIKVSKYFLVDASYTNGPGFLAPYQGTRYHVNEWIGNTPQNFKEFFNLRHSSARNPIERSFGILKER